MPQMVGRCAKGAGTNQDRFCAGSQDSHHEPIRLVVAADHMPGFADSAQRHSTIHGHDEVRKQARALKAKAARIALAELGWKVERWESLPLEQELEGRSQ